jgi:hypothetical protein
LAVIATPLLGLACTDAMAPGTNLKGLDLSGPGLGVSTEYDVGTGGNDWNTLYGIEYGDVQVCKTAAAPGGTFSFDVTVTPMEPVPGAPVVTSHDITVPAIGGTQCLVVYNANSSATALDGVVVVENGPPTGWLLNGIDIKILLYSTTAMDPPVPGLTDSENLGAQTANLYINGEMSRRVTFTNIAAPTGSNGCTPGYWKQAHHFDSWPDAYAPGDGFNSTFGIGTNWFAGSFTLLDGLNANGGGTKALARHAVAALLNAESGFYPMTTAEVIAAVQAAYNGAAGIEGTKNQFALSNELGCPLN